MALDPAVARLSAAFREARDRGDTVLILPMEDVDAVLWAHHSCAICAKAYADIGREALGEEEAQRQLNEKLEQAAADIVATGVSDVSGS